jgi:hypothetical protein
VVGRLSTRVPYRIVDDQGNPNRVRVHLALREPPELARVVAVVASEDHKRILAQALALKFVQYLSDTVVHVGDESEVGGEDIPIVLFVEVRESLLHPAPGDPSDRSTAPVKVEFVGQRNRIRIVHVAPSPRCEVLVMRREKRREEEERLLTVIPQILGGLVGDPVVRVLALVSPVRPEEELPAILVHQRFVGVRPFDDLGDVAVEAFLREPVDVVGSPRLFPVIEVVHRVVKPSMIETVGGGFGFKMELPDECRVIAGIL